MQTLQDELQKVDTKCLEPDQTDTVAITPTNVEEGISQVREYLIELDDRVVFGCWLDTVFSEVRNIRVVHRRQHGIKVTFGDPPGAVHVFTYARMRMILEAVHVEKLMEFIDHNRWREYGP